VTTSPRKGEWFGDATFERVAEQLTGEQAPSLWTDVRRRLAARASARWSLRWLLLLVLASLIVPLLPLPSPAAMALDKQPKPPVAPWVEPFNERFEPYYGELNPVDLALVSVRQSVFGKTQTGPWLGTDAKGRDTLARILWGSRTSLLVALFAALTSLTIGVAWGAIAGLARSRIDNAMMRTVDVLQSLPTIFLVIFLLSFLNAPSPAGAERSVSRETVFFLVIGAVSWLPMARVVRGQVLSLRQAAFVESARTQGASTGWIVRAHIVPNVLPIVLVYLTLTLPSVILYEAFLSFLGLGVEAPKVSWGVLAADGAEAISPLATFWWLPLGPAFAMGATLLALGLLGDALRDALDVKRSEA
jgi:oligopeptide transport system permease protein